MSKKVYVGNLPFNVDNAGLTKLFSTFGATTEAVVIINKFSGRSKGFGFVTFENDADADKAISELNGKEVEGRELKVTEAKPMTEERPRRSFDDRPRRSFGENRSSEGRGRFNKRF